MTCAAIHEGQSCKCALHLLYYSFTRYVGREYQDDLNIRAMHDSNVRKDVEHLEVKIK